jgi:hypothetical protein
MSKSLIEQLYNIPIVTSSYMPEGEVMIANINTLDYLKQDVKMKLDKQARPTRDEENQTTDDTKQDDEAEMGMKFDGQGEDTNEMKPRWSLLPWREVEEVVKVLTAGASEYADFNWQKVEPRSRYVDALLRHFKNWYVDKEPFDKDLKEKQNIEVSHLACLICNALFLMWHDNKERVKDGNSSISF